MIKVKAIKSLFWVAQDNPELMRSQLQAFAKQIPLLYLILTLSTVALSYTHFDSAPIYSTVYIPAALCLVSLVRLAFWWNSRDMSVSAARARSLLQQTVIMTVVLGVCFTAWAFALFPYGNDFAKAHVAFYLGITVLGCIFCLMHVRIAALLVGAVVIIPFAVFFVSTGNPVLAAMALNLTLVAGAIILVLMANYRGFAELIAMQRDLVDKQAETQRLNDENFRLANLDVLTDLPNRRRFFAEFEVVIEQARSFGIPFTVGLVDLDGFKPVNDLYGHGAGDRVLVEVGRRLTSLPSPSAFIARLGGDEFGLIIEGKHSEKELRDYGKSICRTLAEPYALAESVVQMSGSVGFATCSNAETASEHLLECADYALYHAKQASRGTAILFSEELETQIRHHSMVEQCLRHADLENELTLVYQPIFDVKQARTIGFEALARWDSPTLGRVPPDTFIRVAERAGLIGRLTEVLLRKALVETYNWPVDLRVSFNLSMVDIASPEAVQRILAIIEASGVDPRRIDLEITETAVMHDFEQACAALATFKSIGLSIALDDFGSGYSSLSYVHKLPLDKIKIDRSFIAEIETDTACRDIVKSVIDLCRNLKLACIVEGTETAGQLWAMTEIGCWLMQGYFFSKPLAPDLVAAHLHTERASVAVEATKQIA